MKKNAILFSALIISCALISSCKKSEIKISVDAINLHHGETMRIDIESTPAIFYEHVGNTYIAKSGIPGISQSARIDDTYNTQLIISGKYVGKTTWYFSNSEVSKSIPVTVIPRYTTYNEPPLDFNDNQDSVTRKLGKPHFIDQTDTSTIYTYLNYSTSNYLMTVFNESNEMDGYVLNFNPVDTTEIRHFIEERYAPIVGFFMNADEIKDATKVVALLSSNVFYIPNKYDKSSINRRINNIMQRIQDN